MDSGHKDDHGDHQMGIHFRKMRILESGINGVMEIGPSLRLEDGEESDIKKNVVRNLMDKLEQVERNVGEEKSREVMEGYDCEKFSDCGIIKQPKVC